MQAGDLRHHVTIIADESDTLDADGHKVVNEQPVGRTRADIVALRGNELWRAQQVQPEITTRVRMRYRPGMNSTRRLLHECCEGGTLDVLAVIDVGGRKRELELLCKEFK
jgi:SPP1 family predicted phage head-tail adaptor